jgi:hypothetical protein
LKAFGGGATYPAPYHRAMDRAFSFRNFGQLRYSTPIREPFVEYTRKLLASMFLKLYTLKDFLLEEQIEATYKQKRTV